MALVGLGVGAVAVSPLRNLANGNNVFGFLEAPQDSSFPVGRRPIRLRALVETSEWTAPNHTAQDFIGWIQDLQPDTLVRFFSGQQNGSLPLGQCSGYPDSNETLTVQEFLQACLNACANVNSTTLFPRLNMNDLTGNGMTQFLADAQSTWNIVSSLNPPQTLLSLDNWDDNSFSPDAKYQAADIITNLKNIGFKGFACGANAAQGVPNGLATFALFDASISAFNHFQATLAEQPSIMMGLLQYDFPAGIYAQAQQTPDQQAANITTMYQSQGQIGSVPYYYLPYVYWSDINDSYEPMCPCSYAYDATQIFTSPSGPYGGKSIYEITKELMNQYNAITVSPLYTSSSSTVSETTPSSHPAIPWLGGYELALSVLGGLGVLALRRRKRRGKPATSNALPRSRNPK